MRYRVYKEIINPPLGYPEEYVKRYFTELKDEE